MKKDNFYTHKFLPIISIIFFIINIFFTNFAFGADKTAFSNWIEENKEELNKLFKDYDYVIINNYYQNYSYIFYTNAKNNYFLFKSQGGVSGDRRTLQNFSDLGYNHYAGFLFNPNNDNNFRLPTSLVTDFTNTTVEGNSSIINNFSPNNILYNTQDIYDNEKDTYIEKKAFPLPQTTVVVGEITKVEELIPMIIQVMKVIIPIGLLILSMVLLIYVVKSVISRMT